MDLAPDVSRRPDALLEQLGGLLALWAPRAGELQRELAQRGVLCDARGEILRLGPAPYLADDQLREAVAVLEVARALAA